MIFSGKYSKDDIDLILEVKKKEWQEKYGLHRPEWKK